MRDLWRVTLWGLTAGGALTVAAYAGSTDVGRNRMRVAVAEIHEALLPTGTQPAQRLTAVEERRLLETVRTLTAERERLATRIATLEHSVEDITGSIARVRKEAEAAQHAQESPSPAPQPAPPATTPADDVTSSIAPPPAAASPAKPEYGLDLGGAPSIEALRTAWGLALRKHAKLLEGLYPVVHARERPRAAGKELRLVAGPLPTATAAARLCAAITTAGGICQPSTFEGQRLAQH